MKTRFLRVGRSVTALVLAAFLPGCVDGSEQPTTNGGAKSVTKSSAKNAENDSPPIVTAPTPESAPDSEAAPKPEPALPKLSPGLAEVIRLAQAQVGESVMLAYIDKSAFAFNPSLEEILYLHDVGISEPVLTALLHRSKQQADATAKLAEAQAAMTKNMAARKAEVPVLKPMPSIAAPQPEPVAGPAAAQIVVQPVVYTQPVVISQPYFYNELSPYGTWIEIGGYGRCWQPTVAVVDLSWRPYYHRGRWLDTDRGWYWQSDYSWGWAPFHYGRWHQDISCGWVWVPGDTWAPAWVSWRSSSSYCGWAPLPPAARYGTGVGFSYYNSRVGVSFEFGLTSSHYAFLPIGRFCDSTPYRHYVPATQVNTIYQQTTVVNNYITGDNNILINGGVNHRAVTAASRSEIRKVAIRDVTAENARHIQPDRLVKEGDSLAIFRPQVASLNPPPPAPATATTRSEKGLPQQPVAHREAIRKPAVESRPTEGRSLTTPTITPAVPAVANTQPAPQTPLVPLVSATPRTLTVPQTKRLEGSKDARESILNRLELERPKSSQPQTSFQTAPPVRSTFQAPKLSGPTTQPQPTTPSVFAPTTVAVPVPSTSQPIRPSSNASELFSRPEIQRPAPPTRSTFQAPTVSAPTIQQPSPPPRVIALPPVFSSPAPSVSQPSRPQFNPPTPVSQPPPAFVQPSRPQPTPPSQGTGEDQRKRSDPKRNP